VRKSSLDEKNPNKTIAQLTHSGWPRSLEIRENRENGQNKFPAGKNQGISKILKNQGIIREFYKK